METLLAIAKTVGAFFVAMSLWFAFNAFIRRKTGCRGDALEFMTHGCAGCKGDGACQRKKAGEEHHELT